MARAIQIMEEKIQNLILGWNNYFSKNINPTWARSFRTKKSPAQSGLIVLEKKKCQPNLGRSNYFYKSTSPTWVEGFGAIKVSA
jgi:hypothetical protein